MMVSMSVAAYEVSTRDAVSASNHAMAGISDSASITPAMIATSINPLTKDFITSWPPKLEFRPSGAKVARTSLDLCAGCRQASRLCGVDTETTETCSGYFRIMYSRLPFLLDDPFDFGVVSARIDHDLREVHVVPSLVTLEEFGALRNEQFDVTGLRLLQGSPRHKERVATAGPDFFAGAHALRIHGEDLLPCSVVLGREELVGVRIRECAPHGRMAFQSIDFAEIDDGPLVVLDQVFGMRHAVKIVVLAVRQFLHGRVALHESAALEIGLALLCEGPGDHALVPGDVHGGCRDEPLLDVHIQTPEVGQEGHIRIEMIRHQVLELKDVRGVERGFAPNVGEIDLLAEIENAIGGNIGPNDDRQRQGADIPDTHG